MKKITLLLTLLAIALQSFAQGWPSNYKGVMLQGFYWDSFSDSKWVKLEKQADEFAEFFNLIWIPQSASCGGGQSMGYDDLYWFTNYNSSFGTEAELRSMINTFKSKGIGTIADVVINHKKTLTNWVDFPAETYKGTTYQLLPTDICANDDGGETLKWAKANGISLSSNNDTGEDWGGMRDLDHNSENLQKNVHAYLDFLLNDLGYTGVRYDMTKGYAPKFTGLYNSTANIQYSVGEYWDGNANTLKNWIEGTKVDGVVQSATFDFCTRYVARDVFNNNAWNKIYSDGLVKQSGMARYAVAFCENHDTQLRADGSGDPLKNNIAAANAYILLMNGTPCVFLKHWTDYKKEIKQLIYARQMAGITNESKCLTLTGTGTTKYSAMKTYNTSNCAVVVAFGNGFADVPYGFIQIIDGNNYQVYMEDKAESPWISLPSGLYEGEQKVRLTAISADANAKLVYTTDGTTPTASSKQVASGTEITITSPCTLMVGLLTGGTVKNIQTRTYTAPEPFDPYEINVYVNVDKVNWTKVNFWAWDDNRGALTKNPNWPGDIVTQTTTIDGKTFYYQTYKITSADDCANFVWSTGTGSPQTVDVKNITETSYFEISDQKEGGKYLVTKLDAPSAIKAVEAGQENTTKSQQYYNLAGQRVSGDYQGIVIKDGKKILQQKQ
ncbi:MAG: chitobiase/beta-hexosaminidase C-terminal domain-containing protein [Bacteroidaceae bacterium]|nr:chitobiase/beta-hexosaminidase C-terminal domain-containing protein [Bacteroidaceae bacterium]